jgi:hypothetical protein
MNRHYKSNSHKNKKQYRLFLVGFPSTLKNAQLFAILENIVKNTKFSFERVRKKGNKQFCNAIVTFESKSDYDRVFSQEIIIEGLICRKRPYLNPQQLALFNAQRMERRVYISCMAPWTTQESMRSSLEWIGTIEKVFIMDEIPRPGPCSPSNKYHTKRHHQNSSNLRKTGFVTFGSIDQTHKLLTMRDGFYIDNWKVTLKSQAEFDQDKKKPSGSSSPRAQ